MFVRGLLVLVFVGSVAVAAPVPKSLKKPPDQFSLARFSVKYNNAPFEKALEHFAAETGLEWVGDRPDLGTVTLKSLPGKEYTAVEYLDLLNERLELDNFILLRHGKTCYLHPFDRLIAVEKVDTITLDEFVLPSEPVRAVARGGGNGGGQWVNGQWVPVNGVAVVVEDTPPKPSPPPPKRAKTEVATAVIPLTTSRYDDVAPQVKKSLSRFGQVESCDDGRAMRVTDKVDNLRFITKVLKAEPIRCYAK